MKYNKYFDTSTDKKLSCSCGCGGTIEDERVIWVVTCVRIKFGKPVTITSGFRCLKYNASIGSSDGSQHPKGTAVDFQVKDVSPKEVQAFLDDLLAGRFGLGYGSNFTHLDVRAKPARFDY